MKRLNSKLIITCIIVISFSFDGYSQMDNDSTIVKFNFNVEAQLLHQLYKKSDIHIDNVSDIWGNRVIQQSNNITDNPFIHNAFYGFLKNEVIVYHKYKIELDMLLEHRGKSYGLYDMNNIVFFPFYKFSINENLRLFHNYFKVAFKTGCFLNSKIHQGLKIYNIDYQGSNFTLNWKKFFIQRNQIGDLSFAIGLRLGEYYDYCIGYNLINKPNENLNFGTNVSINNYAPGILDSILLKPLGLAQDYYDAYNYYNYGVWGEYIIKDKHKMYFQYEIRRTPYINIIENSAILFGSNIKMEFAKFLFSINPEFRYYGWIYNYAHKDDSVSYRMTSSNIRNYYGNTVGRYLYPLMNYNNSFSQWAIYTDYQFQNIAGIELRLKLSRQLYKNFKIETEAESCTLIKEYEFNGKNVFFYLFYSFQIVYNIKDLFKTGIGISNKSMNLDKHYHTFYMRNVPAIHFFIRKELSKN